MARGGGPAHDGFAIFETSVIVVGLLVLFFLLPHAPTGDDKARLHDIAELVDRGHLTSSRYSLVMPLLSLPVLALGNLVESRSWWAVHFNVLVVAAGLALAYGLLRGRVDPRLFRRFALVLLFVSFLTNRMRDYNAEVLTATLVALGIVCVATGTTPLAGWAAMVVGVVNTPAAIVGLALLAGYETVRSRRLASLAPVLVAAVLIMAEDWARRGGPLATGYGGDHGAMTVMPYSGRPGFSYPFALGLVAILFSFGRGLLFFTPGLVLWLDGRTRRLVPGRRIVTMLLLFTGGLVLVYARWWAWYGGLAWGPRYFAYAAIPASLFLAARTIAPGESALADALTVGVLALSSWVAVTGAVSDLDFAFCQSHSYGNEQLCWFTPDYSSLWAPVLRHEHVSTSAAITGIYCFAVFLYVAAAPAASVARAYRPRAAWLTGWRI